MSRLFRHVANGVETQFPTAALPAGQRHFQVLVRVPNVAPADVPPGWGPTLQWVEAANLALDLLVADDGVHAVEVAAYFCDQDRALVLSRGSSSGVARPDAPVTHVTVNCADLTGEAPVPVALPAGSILEVWAI